MYTKMKELITKLLKNIQSDIIQDQVKKGLTSSGDSAASLEVSNVKELSGELTGASYFYYQIFGRGPGKFPPIINIVKWIENKRIALVDITKESLAFLIARKISKFGTAIYRGEREGLAFDKIVEDNLKVFTSDMQDVIADEIKRIFK